MNTHLKLYLKDVIALVRGIRLKSENTAIAINDRLAMDGYIIDDNDPYTWKYYLNLNGQYHSSDTMMTTISHDTYELIDFTKENLQIHLLTARNFTVGSRYYQDLKSRYPEQEALIKGIIDPVDLTEAIEAKSHKILAYPSDLVQRNEGYLIPELQLYIDNFFTLRHNPDYVLFDPHYYVKLLAGLTSKLFLEILRLRLAACKSNNAHSFHVHQYLLSNSPIGREFHYMTFEQRMWFYRNIRYINRNIGQTSTFETLVKRVMSDRGFSLVGYDLSKNTDGMVDALKPGVEFTQLQINHIPPAMGVSDKSIETLLAMEANQAPDNLEIIEESTERVRFVGETSAYGKVPTKVLESNVIDRTDSDPFTMSEVTLNHWIYLSHFKRYNAVTQITNPSNGEIYNLSMKEAFILFLYSYNSALGITLQKVPSVPATRVIREPMATFDELRRLADVEKVPDYYIRKILNDQPIMLTYISIEAFRGFCRQVWDLLYRHRELRFFAGDYVKEGQLHTLVDRCYMDIRIDLEDDVDYEDWLSERGITTVDMRSFDFMSLAQTLLTTCTGADIQDSSSMKDVHQAMLRIMQSLSSYSVQYIAQINDTNIKVIDGKFPGLSESQFEEYIKIAYDIYAPRIVGVKTRLHSVHPAPVNVGLTGFTADNGYSTIQIPANVEVLSTSRLHNTFVIQNTCPRVGILPLPDTELPPNVTVDNPERIAAEPPLTLDGVVEGYQLSPARLSAFLNRG